MTLQGAELKPIGSVQDTSLLRTIDGYRNAVAARYVALDIAQIDVQLRGEAFVSGKLDGELWFLSVRDGTATLVAPNGRQIVDGPILAAVPAAVDRVLLAGELVADVAGRRPRISDLAAVLVSTSDTALYFAAFDVVYAGDITSASCTFEQRWQWLQDHLPDSGPLRRVEVIKVPGPADVVEAYADFVGNRGFEGIVVRATDTRTYKIKPAIDFDAVILGYTERTGESGEAELRTILLGLEHPDGGIVPICTCSNLGSIKAREELYRRLTAMNVDSSYRHASAAGVLYRFVRPELVAEIRCHDVQPEDSHGTPIWAPLIRFVDGAWEAVGRVASASIIHPVMTRLREDKTATGPDVGWRHLEPYLPAETSGTRADAPASEILRRQVWTKQTGERTDVRKLVVWRTFKEPDYGAYVVHWTDYSQSRKDPLKREVHLAPDEQTATTLADDLVTANIKRGWNEAS